MPPSPECVILSVDRSRFGETYMPKYRAAVIGLGRIASTIDDEIDTYSGHNLPMSHLACYAAVSNTEVVGLADVIPERREAARKRWGIDAVYADFRHMLAETKPDIVSVCTSSSPRGDVIEEIARGGYGVKAVWAEKPISSSLEQADRAISACRDEGLPLAVNCLRRWHDVYRRALQIVQDGLIGEVLHIRAQGTAYISSNGSHLLTTLTMFTSDRAEWVVGEIEDDSALEIDNDFRGHGIIGFPNGVRASFRTVPSGPDEWAFDINCSRGMIRLSQDAHETELWTVAEPLTGQRKSGELARRVFPPPGRRHAAGVNLLHNLTSCIETGSDPNCTGEDAREALEIAIAVRESHRGGNTRVDLPLMQRNLRILSGHPSDVNFRDR